MTDFNSLIERTAYDNDPLPTLIGSEMKNDDLMQFDYFRLQKRLSTRFGIGILDKVLVLSGMLVRVVNVLHFGHSSEKNAMVETNNSSKFRN